MAEIKWIKITTDIFDDEKMKIIDTLPDRDAIIVIWFKLLALTGKKNESGLLFLSPKMAYTDEMLATVFNRPLNTVRLALTTFENFGMIEIAENQVISVINWEKHQNVDGMEKVKEQNRLRQQKRREKQRAENKKLEAPKEDGNVMSRDSHGTDKIRIDKIRIDNNNNTVVDSSFKQEIAMKLKIHKLNIDPTNIIKLSKGDIEGTLKRIDHYGHKGAPYLLAAIRDKYELPIDKKETKQYKRDIQQLKDRAESEGWF